MPKRIDRKKVQNRRRSKNSGSSNVVMKDVRNILRDQAIHQAPLVHDVQLMRLARSRTCSFTLEADYTTLSSPTTNLNTGAISGILGNFPGYTELTAVFDQYRIMQMRLTFIPILSTSAVNSQGVLVYTAFDYDDVTAPDTVTGTQALMQYDTCLIVPAGVYFERIFNPRIAYAAYAAGVFTSYANQKANWLDAASSGVQHFGLKFAVTANASGSALNICYVKAQIFVQFRSQH
jgi:hypothetical protein